MKIFKILKDKKFFFLQVFLTLYIGINLIGGERGLVSYFKKNTYEKKLSEKNLELKTELEYIEHKNKDPAVLIRTIEADILYSFVYIAANLTLVREALILFSIFMLLLVADPLISSFTLILLGLPIILFYLFYRKILTKRGKIGQELMGKKFKTINQSLGLIKETKILHRENFFFDKFAKITRESENINFFTSLVTSTPRLFLEVLALVGVAVVCVVLISLGRPPDTILPIVSLLAISVVRFIPGLNAITASLTTIKFRKPSFGLIVKEINNLNLSKEENFKINHEKEINLKNEIIIKDVSFDYKYENKSILNNINMKIKKSTSVGIIGRSGSGKSTLVDIILGLLEPKNGKILVDGTDIKYNKHLWQKNIGYIPQDIYILDDTIKNNITFGIDEDKVDYKMLSEAIKIAQLETFVKFSKDKLDTIVGNRGAKISGGEKQRIGIARALYNKPKILIFDEATSALDIDNENKILEEIYDGLNDKTIIIISHRNNTVKYCDTIYVMEQGETIDHGPYKEIMDKYKYLKDGIIEKIEK
jgi:ATP-binding cassette subfamily C protein